MHFQKTSPLGAEIIFRFPLVEILAAPRASSSQDRDSECDWICETYKEQKKNFEKEGLLVLVDVASVSDWHHASMHLLRGYRMLAEDKAIQKIAMIGLSWPRELILKTFMSIYPALNKIEFFKTRDEARQWLEARQTS